MTGFEDESAFVEELLEGFEPRRSDAREFALRYRVLLLRTQNGTPADVALGAMPFEERMMERASRFELGAGYGISTCSAEDLVVLKAFANRPQDWLDIEGIISRQAEKLDRKLVVRELEPLLVLKDEPEIESRLRELLEA